MKNRFSLLIVTVLISACTVTIQTGPVTPIVQNPTNVAFGSLPTYDGSTTLGAPTAIPAGSGTSVSVQPNYNGVANGLGWRQLSVQVPNGPNVTLVVIRAVPANVRFRVLYQAGSARSIQDWHAALPDALMIVNANYFDTSNNALGLVISDSNLLSRPTGRSDAAIFQVVNSAPRVRYLWQEPLNSADHFEQAAEAYPLLMASGQVAPINPDLSNAPARRTVFAQDYAGNILFILVPFDQITLSNLAAALGNSGLNINIAVNMDGGASTSLYLAVNNASPYIAGLAPVPVVLAVYPR